MQEVGVVLHKARSGRLIVRLSKKIDPGSVLLDSKGRNMARVSELIGPVSKPYASAVLITGKAKGTKEERVFVSR